MRGRTLPADGRTMLFTARTEGRERRVGMLNCVAMPFAELHRDASANRPTGSNWQTSGPPPFVRLRSERASGGKPSFAHLSLRPCGNSELVSRRAKGVHRSCGAAKVDGKAAHIPTDSTAARQLPWFAAKMPGHGSLRAHVATFRVNADGNPRISVRRHLKSTSLRSV